MSHPPPYGGDQPKNPDERPLPPGWLQQYDPNYKAWFYVNENEKPPVITWSHPLGPPPPAAPAPSSYAPPPGPPPTESKSPAAGGYGYDNPQGVYGGYGGGPHANNGYEPSYGGGFGYPPQGFPQTGSPHPQPPAQPQSPYGGGYPQSQPQQGYPNQHKAGSGGSGAGGLAGKLGGFLGGGSSGGHGGGGLTGKLGGFLGGSSHGAGGSHGQGGYGGHGGFGGQAYGGHGGYGGYAVQQKPHKSGPGMGGMLAAGGAGLLAGGLIGAAIADDGDGGDFDAGGDFDF